MNGSAGHNQHTAKRGPYFGPTFFPISTLLGREGRKIKMLIEVPTFSGGRFLMTVRISAIVVDFLWVNTGI